VIRRREKWRKDTPGMDAGRIWFLDESGVNIDMARIYGRSVGKKRVIDNVPLNTPKTTTMLSSVKLDGTTAGIVFEGALNGDKFIEYLKECLAPCLKKGDTVVMDNLAAVRQES